MTTTAEILKDLRNKKGLSQDELARFLDIDRTTYLKYEKKGNIPTNKVKKLSVFFDISTDYLLGLTDIPDTAENYKRKISPAQDLLSTEDRELLNKYHKLPEKVRNKIEARIEVAYEDMLEKENEVKELAI